jgi:hypothetical protein
MVGYLVVSSAKANVHNAINVGAEKVSNKKHQVPAVSITAETNLWLRVNNATLVQIMELVIKGVMIIALSRQDTICRMTGQSGLDVETIFKYPHRYVMLTTLVV